MSTNGPMARKWGLIIPDSRRMVADAANGIPTVPEHRIGRHGLWMSSSLLSHGS